MAVISPLLPPIPSSSTATDSRKDSMVSSTPPLAYSEEPPSLALEPAPEPKNKNKILLYATADTAPRSRAASAAPTVKSRTPKPMTPRPRSTGADLAGPSRASPAPPLPSKPTENNRPLNVTDALSYLDAVKHQFHDQPDVYNQFLDIMKDFKSQVIDTPDVIFRVSQLFNGNPFLIQGFNTFLPMGYRIDISTDPRDNVITVTTPLGTTRRSTMSQPTPHARDHPSLSAPSGSATYVASPHVLASHVGNPVSRSMTPHQYIAHTAPPYDGTSPPGFPNAPSASGGVQSRKEAALLGNLNNNNSTLDHQSSGEFNHAIQYLNKIKARYADDPTTYKQFLEILQTHHKEQRHAHDSQVYAQVQILFKDAPDLLLEFRNFLPEIGGPMPAATGAVGIIPLTASTVSGSSWGQSELTSVDRSKKVVPPLKRKKKVTDKETTPVTMARNPQSRTKKTKHAHNFDASPSSFSPYQGPMVPQDIHVHTQAHPPAHQPPLRYAHPPHQTSGPGAIHAPPDELVFFDLARKALEARDMYEDFLKLINMFNKDIIDKRTLVGRVQALLGEGELLGQFKNILGWDDWQDNVEDGPLGSIRTGPPEALYAPPVDDGEGPSYRKLPESEIRLACSGRDELCRSVLNDEWVSHPTWASEEAGFVAHKKNSFEEALHKSEEERYEYHVHIEALTRTLALLEPIQTRIEDMTNEERAAFRLKPDFGGSSKSIYHRTIKRVYGRDNGTEIIHALQDCPVVAVPVVLARLRQKDEEWRRAQREWSKTWREVDVKNFYKSLDHQGISFKANDKKNITAKHFVADIESIKEAQVQARETANASYLFARGSVGHQLEFSFQDTSVLHDALKMIYTFLDHSQSIYGPHERRGLEKFIRSFIPVLFMCPAAEFNAHLDGTTHEEDTVAEADVSVEHQRNGRRSAGTPATSNGTVAVNGGVPASDLRKKLLKTAQEKSMRREGETLSRVGSRAPSPAPPRTMTGSPVMTDVVPLSGAIQLLHEKLEDTWIKEAPASSEAGVPRLERKPCFTNTTFYTLLRLLHLLYSRLLLFKETGERLAAQKHVPLNPNPIAVELGLDDPNGPSVVLAQAMEALGLDASANVAYAYLLDAWEKVCDNELDQATFEEHMRWFFGNKAYHVFTLDKLITALVKQVQTLISDNKCRELWSLLQSARAMETLSHREVIRYRRAAERHVGPDEHLYRVEWQSQTKTMRIQLVGAEDPSVEESKTAVGRWREYVDTYSSRLPTEWLPSKNEGESSPPFLRRTIDSWDGPELQSDMVIRISFGTYRMFWEAGSEDAFVRRRTAEEHAEYMERGKRREEERLKCAFIQLR